MNEIRQARAADCRRIAEIQVEGWKAAYRGIVPDEYLDRMESERRIAGWERFVQSEVGRLFVASVDGEVAGFCHVMTSRDGDGDGAGDAEMAAIYVDPHQWRQGLGRGLCVEAIRAARELEYGGLTLWVLAENAMGRKFYEAMGFCLDGAVKTEVICGVALDEVRYRMGLAGIAKVGVEGDVEALPDPR